MSDLRKSQSFIPLERPDQAHTAKTRALFAYWQKLQAAGRPTRASLDPPDMKPFLANLVVGNIEPHPFRVHYTLVGTIIAEFSQFDFTGRYLDEITYTGRDDVDWEICYRHVHATKEAIVGTCALRGTGENVIASYEYAIMPLWRGEDSAGSFIAIEVYDGIDTYRIPDWTKVRLKGPGER